jgi:hypothetical protein
MRTDEDNPIVACSKTDYAEEIEEASEDEQTTAEGEAQAASETTGTKAEGPDASAEETPAEETASEE